MSYTEDTSLLANANPIATCSPPIETHTNINADAPLSDNGDARSETSTIRSSDDNQESFTTYQHKVSAFAQNHFKRNSSEIQIAHMKGGTFNRVVAITVKKPTKFSLQWLKYQCLSCLNPSALSEKNYVLRIPRGDEAVEIKDDITTLMVISLYVPLPTPKIEMFDLTSKNIFERPFMIQNRMPGENLCQLWKTLNMAQKQSVAKQVTQLPSKIASVHGPLGYLALEDLSNPTPGPILAHKFPVYCIAGDQYIKTSTQLSSLDHLLEQIDRIREFERERGNCYEQTWKGFEKILRALEGRGFLTGPCVLVHGDLKDYNLLASVVSPTEVKITAVIDWDTAMFAPAFMAYRAPFWLWTPEEFGSMDQDVEGNANLTPHTDEARRLKQTFVDNASELYTKLAFAPEALIARRMFPFLREGLVREWEAPVAAGLVQEWIDLHPEDGVEPVIDDPHITDIELKDNPDVDSESDD
ncbi:hypothetical protein GQ44DRAFT_731966 [Phaeosphaeriaceae sp. PMI808]|nr:hypothetical protein GQ44DRAFT_731966 [Phaeosphaeriaceae sp. PMI808]